MRILRFELKKILSLPMLWIYLVCCLLLNSVIVCSTAYGDENVAYLRYISQTVDKTGTQIGKEFKQELSNMPEETFRLHLQDETENMERGYSKEDVEKLEELVSMQCGLSGFWKEKMSYKYDKLQESVENLLDENADMSVYGADSTYKIHQTLFSSLFRAIITESCLLAVLIMLYILGYEAQNHAEQLVYVTNKGKNIVHKKILSGFLTSMFSFGIIAGGSLGLFFGVYDFSGIWECSVSSQFNYIRCMNYTKPFWTWVPFTVKEYLCAMLMLSVILVLVFAMFGASIGLLCKNTYMGFILFLAIAIGMMALPFLATDLGLWGIYFLTKMLPVPLWFLSPQWFTDMSGSTLIPWGETIGTLVNVILFTIIICFELRYFKIKDIL